MSRDWGFGELADELEELANRFDSIQRGEDARDAIEDGVYRALDQEIVPEAQSRAERHVGSGRARTITHRYGEWSAGRYRHYYYATDDIVRYHEFGTGGHAGPGHGTVDGRTHDGRPGYIIRPRGNYPLGIPAQDWNGPNWMVNSKSGKVHLEYVVHPGVRGKHFMEQALRDNQQELSGYILSQINSMFREKDLL
jgi:hypothetical protein